MSIQETLPVHDFGGRAIVIRTSFSPSSLSMLCKVPSVAHEEKTEEGKRNGGKIPGRRGDPGYMEVNMAGQ